jgi:hypothetical protein
MEKSVEIVGELSQISPFLAESRPGMPYSVPQGYFENLTERLGFEIIQNSSRTMRDKIQNRTYHIPEGYFESLAGNLLEKIRKQDAPTGELAEIAPLLNRISRENVYALPAGYFEQAVMIPKKQKAKLVTMARRWTQYAAAAVIAGILVTTAFLFTDNTGEPEYKKYQRLDLPAELDKMSEHELVGYLVNPETLAPVTASNTDAVAEVRNNIQSLSDEELDLYLKENTDTELTAPVANN